MTFYSPVISSRKGDLLLLLLLGAERVTFYSPVFRSIKGDLLLSCY